MRILFLLHPADQQFVFKIKSLSPGWLTGGKVLVNEPINYLSELDLLAQKYNCQAVLTTDYKVLKILFPEKKFKDADTNGQGLSVLNFQGNLIRTKKGLPVLITAPLRHLYTVKEAPFLFSHFLEKLGPNRSAHFLSLPPINVEYCTSKEKLDQAVEELALAPYLACDIETGKGQRITDISFSIPEKTFHIAPKDLLDIFAIRKILANDSLKIFQNGKFDNLHLIHWNCPARNWYFDTYGMMQCWYAELKRSLDFIGSFFLDNLLYWKDEADSNKAEYNAKDTHTTLYSFLAWIKFAPQWAKDNYVAKFPAIFPSISCEFQGLKLDIDRWQEMTLKKRREIDENYNSLNACLGTKTFNPGSSKQVIKLLNILSPKLKFTSADKPALAKSSYAHPLNAHILDKLIAYRKAAKLHSTYLDARLWNDRVTYSLNPFGTETGRSSCTTSSFYEIEDNKYKHYGIQLQNIPPEYKTCIMADPGFLICEMDKEQAESRGTAYLSQSLNMIDAVENSPDFHSFNASAFFGIPFDELWDTENHRTKNKPIRDLSKRTNHGANYNMAEHMLIITMGESNLWKAKALLKLPAPWGLKEIAAYLLNTFDETYPRLRDKENGWYGELIHEWVMNQGKIKTPDGWTRIFFGDPREAKSNLNELVAHSPQHLNSAMVEDGFIRIWYEMEDPKTFRTCGAIHDSILFQVHQGHKHLIKKAQDIYDATSRIIIHGREMFVPSAMSGPKEHWK